MKTGEKIAQLRREKNLTQEQLAQIMNVSRQSISKWESNVAYPETEKLIQLGKIFECSMDYLLNEEIEVRRQEYTQQEYTQQEYSQQDYSQQENTQQENAEQGYSHHINMQFVNIGRVRFEYKSKKTFLGMPLVHICAGYKEPAMGVFAVGLRAKGIISIGLLSVGLFSFGLISIGAFAFGLLALGVLSFGTIAAGVIAFGAVAIGIVSIGGCSIGLFACGGYANGSYVAIGDTAIGKIAIGKSHTEAEYAINHVMGSCYEFYDPSGDPILIGRNDICQIIDQNVPKYLEFFKNIIKVFIV